MSEAEVAALAPWLLEHVPGLRGPIAVRRFAGGQSNPTFLIEAASGDYVLRAQPPGQLLPGAHRVDREARVMRALAGRVPVPEVLAEGGADGPLGRGFIVMARVAGVVHWDPALPGMSPRERAAHYAAMNRTLAALHGVEPASVGLSDFGRPGDYFARQYATWLRAYRAAQMQELAEMEALIGWLAAHLPPDDGQVAIVHGDWRIDNVMFAPGRAEVAAVLDWELATLGHPLADIAYQCMQWRMPHAGRFRGLGGLDRAALGLPEEWAHLEDYCRLRGIDPPAHWPFLLAFAAFRLAAILEGVGRRAAEGNAADPEGGRDYGALVPVLAWIGVAAAG